MIDEAGYNGIRDEHIEKIVASLLSTGLTEIDRYAFESHCLKCGTPGVDVRAEGAHVVAPPSIYKNGNQYYWLHGGIDEISPADENLYKLLHILECNKL